jgi:N-acetylneuraminic acid mutarotase
MSSPTNVPGSRTGAVSWIDAGGNLWLFGGYGWDSAGTIANLNDLWEYSAGSWTWVSGGNVVSQNGVYGTQGMSSPTNVPGSRTGAVSWIDAGGNLWLFGGTGYDSTGTSNALNDLWQYSGGAWTWISGANLASQRGAYGTQGTPSPANVPGARSSGFTWIDSAGTLWLFGGTGYDSQGTTGSYLNDLWKYSGGQWTWVSGSSVGDKVGSYGTLGTPSPTNAPGGRGNGVSWRDSAGNLWLFGGYGYDSTSIGFLNDLWQVGVAGAPAAGPGP